MTAEIIVGILFIVLFFGLIAYGYSRMFGWKVALKETGIGIGLGALMVLGVMCLIGVFTF